ncbi:MAG: hypothetical protein F4103_05810 [Boseongicola sp. SB0673_bin_14]|nr:hypothetical protein [Boseongicola sp. SB0673_bin_14]
MPEPRLALAGPVLATMLTLSGCGGGGGSQLADMPGILVDATKAGEMAKGAAVAARTADELAGIAAGNLTVIDVHGDSTRAQLNSQAVLDAETTVRAQFGIAQEALKDTQDARNAAKVLQNVVDADLFRRTSMAKSAGRRPMWMKSPAFSERTPTWQVMSHS